jgi:peptidoglycan hydrolase-like protein with peptidoglycan-binding domain
MMPPIVKKLPLLTQKRFEHAYTNTKRPIAVGDNDDIAVSLVQVWLTHLGYSLPISVTITPDDGAYRADGVFGDETRRAVQAFQMRNGLRPDGMVGHDTLDKICENLYRPKIHTPLTRAATVHVAMRRYRCPPGALICSEPPR